MIQVTPFMWYGLALAAVIGLARLVAALEGRRHHAAPVQEQVEDERDAVRARARSVSAACGNLQRGLLRPRDPVERVRVLSKLDAAEGEGRR